MGTQGPDQTQGQTPEAILARAFHRATASLNAPLVPIPDVQQRVEYVGRNLQNRAGVRLLMACLVAKARDPRLDARKPYTEIGTPDAFSGRTYDEHYVTPFITEHNLPCNPTTAFLTPALRNRNVTLTPDVNLVGRPARVYADTVQLLADVQAGRVADEDVLAEAVRCLINLRDEQKQRMETLLVLSPD